MGAVIGGFVTLVVTISAAYLTTATTGAADTKIDQLSDGKWLRYSVLPVGSSQLGYLSAADQGLPTGELALKSSIDLERTMFKIQLTGLSRSGVRIYDGRIRVQKRTEPSPGFMYLPIGPQGGDKTIGLVADLDEPKPGLRDADDPGNGLYFQRHDVTLAFGEHVTLTVTATAARSALEWDVELGLQRDGDDRRSTMVLNRSGRPWVTSGVRSDLAAYSAAYEEVTFGSWQRHDDVAASCTTIKKLQPYCAGS